MKFEIEKHNQYNLKDGKTSICPLCSKDRKKSTDKCMMLDWERGLGTCQHCGEVIQLHTYKSKQNIKNYKRPEWLNKTDISDKAVKWFEKRGIKQFTLRHMKITDSMEFMPQINKKINTIQFNYFQFDELINIKYRDGAKNYKLFKDAELIFYNLNGIYKTKDVIICEGEMDALSYYESGLHNAVSVPNGAGKNLDYLDNCIEYFEDKERIYISTDNDEAGKILEAELLRRLGIGRCYKVNLSDCKDSNEFLVKYGAIKLKNAIDEAELYPIEDISTIRDDGKQLDDFFINGMPKGYKIGKDRFDESFSIDDGRFIVVTGIPTHGKSEFVDEMIVGYNINYGWKACFCSPENQPVILHKAKIIPKLIGYYPKGYLTNNKDYDDSKQYLDDNFFFVSFKKGSYDLKRCLDKAKELIFRKGIKCLVLDPFNKIRLKESLNKSIPDYTNDYLGMIDDFARENSITIILIAHPRKLPKEGGKYAIPDFYDIKGGGEFYDMSPFGLSIYRDFENNYSVVKNLKVKFAHLGRNQAETTFFYNINNGRYSTGEANNENYIKKEEKQLVFENKVNENVPF